MRFEVGLARGDMRSLMDGGAKRENLSGCVGGQGIFLGSA